MNGLAAAKTPPKAPAGPGSRPAPRFALWTCSLALQAHPDDISASLGAARALEAAVLPSAAISRLREILARHPGRPAAVTELAELELRT